MPESPPPLPSLPVALAAEVAGVDRRRFNEAVFDGSYPCAPNTKSRQRRFFDEADVLGMCLFARLMNYGSKSGVHKNEAGRIACDVVEHFRDAQRASRVLTNVLFPSGIQDHLHGIPRYADAPDAPIPEKAQREFICVDIRVASLIDALRTRYQNMSEAERTEASIEGDDA